MSETMTANPVCGTDWAELGRAIARKTAEGWGSEWTLHYWDEVEEQNEQYQTAHNGELDALWKADNDEEYYRLKNLCFNAWKDELARLLRLKRETRTLGEVFANQLYAADGTVHLQLAGHYTIMGKLSGDAKYFTFCVSRFGQEAKIGLPLDAEFAAKPMAARSDVKIGRLSLRHESGGYRHYLGHRDLHCGYPLTLVLPCGAQIRGRYESNLTREDCTPVFYFTLAGGTEGTQRLIRLPEDAEFALDGRAL